jgi:RNA polymerase sigma factor (sigma-70 family)
MQDMTQPLEKELETLYKKWPDQKRFLKSLGCYGPIAEDLFQEALLIFVRKREESSFELSVEPFFFVRSTCKLLWYNHARKNKLNIVEHTDIADQQLLEPEWIEKEMRLGFVEKALAKLGEKCQEMLQLFYGLGWNMTDIAKKLDLRNDKVAKVLKHRCLEKARGFVVELDSENH